MWRQSSAVQIYRSFDHGYFPDPAYCLWIAHLGDRYIAFKEKLWFKTIASDIAKDIKAESEGMRVVSTYCDPTMDINTGADILTIKDKFELEGVPLETSINNRALYASAIHQALGEESQPGIPRLQLYSRGVPYLIKTLPQQRFDPKHQLELADHHQDHACVALAYFLISSGSMERRAPSPLAKVKKWLQPKKSERFVLGSENVKKDIK